MSTVKFVKARTNQVASFACLWVLAGCAFEGGDYSGTLGTTTEAVQCDTDDRSSVTALTNPNGAVGRVLIDGSPACSGVVIAPTKVMTAAHCVDSLAPTKLSFEPQFGIVVSGQGPVAAVDVTRVVQAEEFDGNQTASSDWALLTVNTNLAAALGADYQAMSRSWLSSPGDVSLMGYHSDIYINRPGREDSCTVNILDDGFAMRHDCDAVAGVSGGPLFSSDGTLWGIQSGNGTSPCAGSNGNTAANGRMFAFAPDNPGGLATSYLSNGRNRVWATDRDWTLVAERSKVTTAANSDWTPWNAFDSAFSNARKIAASNLEDNREVVWVINSAGVLRHKWQNSVGGSWTSSWSTQSTPTTIKDVAVTGGQGNRTQLFVLGTNNILYTTYKTGGSSSVWASWVNLGTQSGATAISAVRWSGMSVVFIASASGMVHTWGNDASFATPQSLGTSSGGFVAVSSGLLDDGRIHLQAVNGNGVYMTRTRLNSSSWSGWTTFGAPNPINTTGFVSLATGRITDGRLHLLGIASNGEIYETWEEPSGGFRNVWTRFYK